MKNSMNIYLSVLKILILPLLKFQKKGFILYGHGVSENKADEFIEQLHIPLNDFKIIIKTLIFFKFKFVNEKEFIEISENNFKYHTHWVFLTFDDTYENIYEVAFPYLSEQKIPFSIFISTKLVSDKLRIDTFYIKVSMKHSENKLLTNEILKHYGISNSNDPIKNSRSLIIKYKKMGVIEINKFMKKIRSLLSHENWTYFEHLYINDKIISEKSLEKINNSDLVSIGSHNNLHLILNRNIDSNRVMHEMKESKKWLHNFTGVHTKMYAYPNGGLSDFSRLSRNVCKSCGYKVAFTTNLSYPDDKTDRFEIGRIALWNRKYLIKVIFISLFRNKTVLFRIIRRLLHV